MQKNAKMIKFYLTLALAIDISIKYLVEPELSELPPRIISFPISLNMVEQFTIVDLRNAIIDAYKDIKEISADEIELHIHYNYAHFGK